MDMSMGWVRRSTYTSKGEKDNILENQIKYWGIKGIHYHQLLSAGENTLNLKLACEPVI